MDVAEPAIFRRHNQARIYPVVLCDVVEPAGSPNEHRLFSTKGNNRTLFQDVILWNAADSGLAAPVVAVRERRRFSVVEQLAALELPASTVIVEPDLEIGAASVVAMAALWLRARDRKALMLVEPANQASRMTDELRSALAASLYAAHCGAVVSFESEGSGRALRPSQDFFLVAVSTYLSALRAACPSTFQTCERRFAAAVDTAGYLQLGPAPRHSPALSVEMALGRKVDRTIRLSAADAIRPAAPANV